MNLIITWADPTPIPSCGYTAYYRRKGDPAYTAVNTSGSTSGTTAINIYIANAANYEGYIQSNCCSENFSIKTPWGVNSYSPLNTVISIHAVPISFLATVTSLYPNPYPTYITGAFNWHNTSGTTSVPYTVVYPANVTSAVLTITGSAPVNANTDTVSNNVISAIVPSFDGGGTLQQFDSVLTPPYFAFYDGSTSGVTWAGSPSTLPSFTLDQFNITAQDGGGNTTAGNLLVSWAQSSIYGTSGSTIPLPYNQIIFQVKDAGNNIIGTLTYLTGTLGLINAVIPLTRSSALYPLITSTPFSMICRWGNSSLISSNVFYLP